MFAIGEINRINLEHSKRVKLAKDLGLNHFDIRLNVQFRRKDQTFILDKPNLYSLKLHGDKKNRCLKD